MSSHRPSPERVAEVTRRRLELLSAELAPLTGPGTGDGFDAEAGDEPPEVEPPGEAAEPDPRRSWPPYDDPGRARRDAPEDAPNAARHRSLTLRERATSWVADRLPAGVQSRVWLTQGHLAVIAVLVAAALAVTTWWVLRADAGGVRVPPAAPASAAAQAEPSATPPTTGTAGPGALATPAPSPPPTAAASPSPAAAGPLVVDVAGKVRRPGITTLPAGSRVADALEAAGGARKGVSLTRLNLARPLADGEQILVGVKPAPGISRPAATGAAQPQPGGSDPPLVHLNSATQADLETLPGVGPVTAQAILEWRSENGAFSSVDELLEVSGIGDATLADLAPFVTVG